MLKYIMNFGDGFEQSIFLYGASRNMNENIKNFYEIKNNDDGEYAKLEKGEKLEYDDDGNLIN